MRVLFAYLACFFCVVILISCSTTLNVSKVIDDMEIDLNLNSDEMAFTYFDLSSGEATLIQSGTGGNILIGTGDVSAQVELAKRLHMYHVTELEALILTSDQSEYIGNSRWVIENLHVKKVIVPNGLKKNILNELSHEDSIPLVEWKSGKQKEILPGLEIDVLYMNEPMEEHTDEMGVVISFKYGEQRTLYMGLANSEIEEMLLNTYSLKSAILKVGDFGSHDGTSNDFLKEVDPQVAILFRKNGQNPDATVLERMQETWIDVYQTFQTGSISIKCTPEYYEIYTVQMNM